MKPALFLYARLNRLTTKIVKSLLNHPDREYEPFSLPVSKLDYSDYYELIESPCDLDKMLRKAKEGRYISTKEVLHDFTLIKDNCRTYCLLTFPSLCEVANDLHKEALILVKRLGLDLGSDSVLEGLDLGLRLGSDLEDSELEKANEEEENEEEILKMELKDRVDLVNPVSSIKSSCNDSSNSSTATNDIFTTSISTNNSNVSGSNVSSICISCVNNVSSSGSSSSSSSSSSSGSNFDNAKKNFTVCVRLNGSVDFLVGLKGPYQKSTRVEYHLEDACRMTLVASDGSLISYKVIFIRIFCNHHNNHHSNRNNHHHNDYHHNHHHNFHCDSCHICQYEHPYIYYCGS
jgi:hypothetical protein